MRPCIQCFTCVTQESAWNSTFVVPPKVTTCMSASAHYTPETSYRVLCVLLREASGGRRYLCVLAWASTCDHWFTVFIGCHVGCVGWDNSVVWHCFENSPKVYGVPRSRGHLFVVIQAVFFGVCLPPRCSELLGVYISDAVHAVSNLNSKAAWEEKSDRSLREVPPTFCYEP